MRHTQLYVITFILFLTRAGFAQVYVPEVHVLLKNPAGALVIMDTSTEQEAIVQVIGKLGKPIRGLNKVDFLVRASDNLSGEILSVDTISIPNSRRLALSFVLDNSGSMFHAYDTLTKYLDTLVFGLPAGSVASAVVFDDKARTPRHLSTKRRRVYIAAENFNADLRRLSNFWHYYDSIRSDFTPLYDAIAEGLRMIELRLERDTASVRDVMVVITDGSDNASRTTLDDLTDMLQGNKVTLFAINFRTEPDPKLEYLAHHGRGSFFYAEDLHDLKAALRDLSRDLTLAYRIRYKFPPPAPSHAR
ncbi:MAG: VWA domain-containing protein [Candidatus Kapaibacterium sp.]|jgi:hypothetical protein